GAEGEGGGAPYPALHGHRGPGRLARAPVQHATRVPHRGGAVHAVGDASKAQGAFVAHARRLHRVLGLPGRPSAALTLVRAEVTSALVASVATIRGAAEHRGATARDHGATQSVLLPAGPGLFGGQRLVAHHGA